MEGKLHLSQPASILNLQNPNPLRNAINLHTLSSANACTGIFRAVDPRAKAHLCNQASHVWKPVQVNTSEASVTQARLKSEAPYSTPSGFLRDLLRGPVSTEYKILHFIRVHHLGCNKNTFQAVLSIRAQMFLSWSFYLMLKFSPKKYQPLSSLSQNNTAVYLHNVFKLTKIPHFKLFYIFTRVVLLFLATFPCKTNGFVYGTNFFYQQYLLI